ncbi:DMT family transporter [Tenacibaculum jejuense]|uniref:Permease of the drug/metabolite transporter (DMT) superfamily n=1 Tax=Tenacibaculum jejuense TaxID=584609 RepID=A0A238UCX5_9FLAO|nr:DMT family transporter [Tenacibaculum jejuense]SNR16428.1 Permease of the drug/metabolite transporter (DMT) superfamily [Tenacibaculum jejuense]
MKKAIYLMLLSALCFTVMNVFVKYLSGYSTYQKVFFRAIGSLVFTMGYLLYYKIPIGGKQKKLLILRGLVGVTSMGLFFASTDYLSIGTAVSLRYTSPIFAAILAVFFLKEKIFKLQWVYFILAFVGVLLIKGFDNEINIIGLSLILISAFFSGLVYVVISKIGTKDHPVVIVNYFMWISTILGGVLSISNWKTPQGNDWFILLSLGLFGYFGQLFMTKAYQLGSANKIVPLKYVEVIFTMILGMIWFGDQYPLLSVLGVLLVIVALILNVLFKQKVKG